MGKGTHYYQNKKKPYLKKWEWAVVITVLSLIVLGFAGYYIVQAINDDSLPVKHGKVVAGADNWIIVNEGTAKKPKYYQYGTYDFSALPVTVEQGGVNEDDNSTGLYLYPNDQSYDYGYVYGNKNDYAELSTSVHDQMPSVLQNGDIHDIEPFARGGRTGNIYWYTNWITKTDADGVPMKDENGNEIREYTQIFSCYMPASRGCVIVRVSHKGDSEAAYVDPSVGYEEVGAILDCISID